MRFPGAVLALVAVLALPVAPALAVSGQAASTETAVEAQYAGDSSAAPTGGGQVEVKGAAGTGQSQSQQRDDGDGATAPASGVAAPPQEAQPAAAQPLGDALPFTGAELLTLLLAGGALIGTGVALRRLGRTERPGTMAG